MSRSDGPRASLGRALEDAVSEAELAHAWRGIAARRTNRRARRVLAIAALALATAAIVMIVIARPDPSPRAPQQRTRERAMSSSARGPIAHADGAPLSGVLRGVGITLDEGSSVEPDALGDLEVLANDEHEVALHLRAGGARFSITPGGARRWRVEGGGVSVEVVGTVFSVRRDGARVHVAVERGVVIVRGAAVPDGVQRLGAGASIDVGPPPTPPDVEPAPAPRETPRRAARTEAQPPDDEPARWLDDADHARREGRVDDAITALGAIVERHPRSPEAPVAAFTRARLLTSLGREAEARDSYARAIELGLPPALDAAAREALAR
ncbi:FecR domain-containing protein [Sandaracinus amylolyticus]|uniref:FecR protein domain-containing protein n=1 Tax=Sandaracinus amylolyticus TaxID=927083 RepID=A0A0F6SGP2_9BACT|nr:FecR domain-containing protein [Sandaracinus amylolyticus]AKF09039.1 hypothetical protein DB32_006188 [Sandaracinus amylolyticus]